jgi:4-hydroxybutyrate CoA-transferase
VPVQLRPQAPRNQVVSHRDARNGGAGSQIEFVIGAMLSKGGRSVTALHSTASGGKISRIVPMLEKGTIISIPRTFADYVVTEFGIARLWGKSQRERALEMVSIAHPGFLSVRI